MSLLDAVKDFLTIGYAAPPLQERSNWDDYPGMAEQFTEIRNRRAFNRPWRTPSITEALGVPAIHRAVSLIANTGGGLSMEAWRKGVKLENEDRPRVIVRPDPFTIPREFYRGSFYNMATRGEADYWIAKRDSDGQALSVINMPPHEVAIDGDPSRPDKWEIMWRDKKIAPDDFRQVVLMKEPGQLRGYGPLQVCGAAVSIAVESQEWAANFFADGGYPSLWIKAAGDLSGGLQGDPDVDEPEIWMSEIQRLKEQWVSGDKNTPKVTDEGILDVKQFDPNPSGAQMLDSRQHQVGDAARMFGIPGALMEYAVAGSSLTYQNLAEIKTNFLETCLIPNYLEPVEQTISDLLTRSTVARFNVEGFKRADEATRWAVYTQAVGVIGPEEAAQFAREREGMAPGDVEMAAVPFSLPQAIPSVASMAERSLEVRCGATVPRNRSGVLRMVTCNKLLSTDGSTPQFCPRCKSAQTVA